MQATWLDSVPDKRKNELYLIFRMTTMYFLRRSLFRNALSDPEAQTLIFDCCNELNRQVYFYVNAWLCSHVLILPIFAMCQSTLQEKTSTLCWFKVRLLVELEVKKLNVHP